jgi:hypothetical protein
MTNYDLIQKLIKLPMDMEVRVPSWYGEFEYAKVCEANVCEIETNEGETITAIVIDE